ncbi:MAG: cupredoxin domain-containing protein, partial [Actinomycetota bacterium]
EGETVTFSVTNPGQALHEFTLGDQPFQEEHESDMTRGSAMTTDTPYSVVVRPGETKTLTWRFTAKGKLLYGCHQTGHYRGGMVGSITVT